MERREFIYDIIKRRKALEVFADVESQLVRKSPNAAEVHALANIRNRMVIRMQLMSSDSETIEEYRRREENLYIGAIEAIEEAVRKYGVRL